MAGKYFPKKYSMKKIKEFSKNLSPEIIIQLYKLGIFLMAENRFDKELYFVEPEKRALLPIGNFKYPKSLIRFCKKNPFSVSVNKSFKEVKRWNNRNRFKKDESYTSINVIRKC